MEKEVQQFLESPNVCVAYFEGDDITSNLMTVEQRIQSINYHAKWICDIFEIDSYIFDDSFCEEVNKFVERAQAAGVDKELLSAKVKLANWHGSQIQEMREGLQSRMFLS